MAKFEDNISPYLSFVEGSAPSSPAATNFRLYFDSSDHLLKWKNSAGTVVALGAGLTDPMTTRGDIIVRNAANATARLAVGAAGKIFSSDGTDAAWGNGPMTTAGDIIIGGASGLPTRLAAGATSGHVLTSNGSGAAPSYQAVSGGGTLASALYTRTAGDYTTTSTTFVDVDGTNLSLTITTGAHRVLIGFVGSAVDATSDAFVYLDVDVDGTRIGNAQGLTANQQFTAGAYLQNASFTVMSAILSAASHTFKLQWRVSGGTATLRGGTSGQPVSQFWVMEQGG